MNNITYKFYDKPHTQGIGGVLQGELLAYFISKYYNYDFIRNKFFYYKGHEKNFNSKKWRKIFNFFGSTKIKKKILKVHRLSQLKIKYNQILSVPLDISLNFFKKLSKSNQTTIVENFRKIFWKKNIYLKKKSKKKIIVLHIRNFSKGDEILGDESLNYEIFSYDYKMPYNNPIFYNNWYSQLIKKIFNKNKLNKKNSIMYICSTGDEKDFFQIKKKLKKFSNLKLRLNYNSFQDFELMINADYLVMAQSSFSYLISFINDKKKYIRNGFRQPLPPDVEIVKDYYLENYSYLLFIYNNILKIFFKIKLKLKKL